MSRPLVVHFTSHSCLVSNPAALRPDIDGKPGDTPPRWIGCRFQSQRPLKPERNRYSTRIEDVTCVRCEVDHAEMAAYDADGDRHRWNAGKRVAGDTAVEREIDAHRLCCAARGAPLLVDPAAVMLVERVAQADRLRDIAMPVVTIFPIDDDEGRAARMTLRTWIEKRVAELEPHEIEILQPAINECTMAADVEELIRPMLIRARAHTLAAMESIRSGALTLLAGGAA